MIDGPKIRGLRRAKYLTLRQMADMSAGALSPGYLSEIENGKAPNPTKHVTRALAKALGVKEIELFTFADHIEGEFKMCKYRREYPTMNGWVYYCDLAASGQQLTEEELTDLGCTEETRTNCRRMMEFTCGKGLVPEPAQKTGKSR